MDTPVFWLKRAYLAMRKSLDEYLTTYGLTSAQLDILMFLWLEDGLEHKYLQEQLGVTSPTLTSVIDTLVSNGYVERRISPEDARVKQIFLTAKGRELHNQIGEAGSQFDARLLSGFTSSEEALFMDWLKKAARNMGYFR